MVTDEGGKCCWEWRRKPTGVDREKVGGKKMKIERRDNLFKEFSYRVKEMG